MDNLTVQIDIANKRGNFTASKALGAYSTVSASLYNFATAPDLNTLKAIIYTDDGTAITTCTTFVEVGTNTGNYVATLSLATDNAIAYFHDKKPSFQQDLTLDISDANTLYCNVRIPVKNNPNAIPSSPTPIEEYFLMDAPRDGETYGRKDGEWVDVVDVSDEGFDYDLTGTTELKVLTNESSASEVRRFLLTLAKYLKTKGVI